MAQLGVRRKATTSTSTVGEATIPDKLYFRIGEVAELCGVPAYVLRFWESEFSQLRPNKGGTGQRLYRRRDVLIVLRIKSLLYEGGFTIPGARQMLQTEQRKQEPQLTLGIVETEGGARAERKALQDLQSEMRELLEILGGVDDQGARVKMRAVQPIRPARVRPTPDVTTPDLFNR